MLCVNDNCQGASNSAKSLRHDESSSGVEESTSQSHAPLVSRMSLAQLDSLIVPFTRPKIDAFTEEEIKLILEEIGKRRHVLLTNPRKSSRLMKTAWEEVARSVALRNPSNHKRTAKQIKRKWRDIVGKTKKKIREGQLKQEIQFNEVTAMVTQFLASTSQEMRQDEVSEMLDSDEETSPFVTTQTDHPSSYYDQPDNSGDNDSGNKIKESDDDLVKAQLSLGVQSAQETDGYFSNPATDLAHNNGQSDENDDSLDSDIVMIAHMSTNGVSTRMDDVNANLEANLGRSQMNESLNKELLRQSRDEHALRMEVLEMKRRYWQIKIEALLQERRVLAEVNENQKE
ncbi:unnamed protein product [Hymenolepis diminuta]|uniref:Myb_DNA-bind_5 domain-containing protein n=1 Tax=Hymenolepis diminuta TaxID=6216 RepID=A0A0R3SHZ0_HYMDI|nr:unnamed protein product [Hymenolepis diminuta]VUZ39432.1 unnamed protein product [Hymenolepis diminuta]